MQLPLLVDRSIRRCDRLGEHLAAEDVFRFRGVAAAIEIFLDALHVEQIDDVAQDRIHGGGAYPDGAAIV